MHLLRVFLHTEFSNKIVAGHPLVGDPLYCAGGVTKSTPHPELKVQYTCVYMRVMFMYVYMCMLVSTCVCLHMRCDGWKRVVSFTHPTDGHTMVSITILMVAANGVAA